MSAYHYQCANCYCTLSLDEEPANGIYHRIINGELCLSCEREQQAALYDDDD